MGSHGDAPLLGIAAAVVIVAALYFARVVFIPLALAILLALLLTPVIVLLERLRLPRVLAVFLVVVAIFAIAALAAWRTAPQFVDLTNHIPSYEKSIKEKIRALKGNGQSLNQASKSVADLEKEITASAAPPSTDELKRTSSASGSSPGSPLAVEVVTQSHPLESVQTLLEPLATAGIVLVFAIFILLGRENLRDRLIRLSYGGRLTVMTQAMEEAVQRINRYLLLQLLVNAAYGVLIGIALHFIGVPNSSLWGLGAAILRFLPYIGAPFAAFMPITLALAVFPGWSHALLTAGVFLMLELIVANAVEPLLYGSHVGLSPLAILVAAVFWTSIWGLPGLVLSTPLTVCLVVVGR